MRLTVAQRKAVLKAQLDAWPKATKPEKSAILDAVCQVNRWHRDHARKVIRTMLADPTPPGRRSRSPVLRYDQPVIDALVTCWAVLDGPTGKRLQPALPDLVATLVPHGELDAPPEALDALLAMSAATMDRRLKPYRTGLVALHGRSHTRPGSLLKTSIPIKTWADWDDTSPGFIEIDLVGHDGGDNNGEFCWSLDAVDVATGWTETITVRTKGERVVADGLQQLQLRFPFAILGTHSDNGSEFINHHLRRWCEARQITFTRGRANRSNDQAHIEQKNWTVVRRCVGYHRYDTPRELDLLNQFWLLESTRVNLFLPQQKLRTKTRTGAKVTKTYDQATTPYRRLLRDHPDLLHPIDARLQADRLATTNPAQLARDIDLIQRNLTDLAKRRGQTQRRAKANAIYLSRTKMTRTRQPQPTT